MNAFLFNGYCEDDLNHGDCMFDGFDCCGYDHDGDGDYDDSAYFIYFDIAPGDTTMCTECLCKGFRTNLLVLGKTNIERLQSS